jgi:hypothetical protein
VRSLLPAIKERDDRRARGVRTAPTGESAPDEGDDVWTEALELELDDRIAGS